MISTKGTIMLSLCFVASLVTVGLVGAVPNRNYILKVTIECGAYEKTNKPVLNILTNVTISARAKCRGGDQKFISKDLVHYTLPSTLSTGSKCKLWRKENSSTYAVDIDIHYGEVGNLILTKRKITTAVCNFDASPRHTIIDRPIIAPIEMQHIVGSTIAGKDLKLSIQIVDNKDVNPALNINRMYSVLGTYTGSKKDVGLKPVSCDVIAPNGDRYSILRAGCGDGLIFPRKAGFMTSGKSFRSLYFEAFHLGSSDSLSFDCNVTLCTDCDGSSCETYCGKVTNFNITNGKLTKCNGNNRFKDTCQFNCLKGFNQAGNGVSTCGPDGIWTVPAIVCTGPSHKPSSYHWSYDGMYGPDSWSKHYEYCGGQSQSPINIDTRYAEFDETLTEFNFTQFDVLSMPRTFNISNNGHSASALIPTDMYTSGGGLPGIFKTAEFHFHWGSKDDRGSEHGIDNRNYPLEMHIVHYNTKYGTLANAKSKPDGLAVLGVMFEVSEQDNDDFQPIVAGLKNIRHQGDRDTINDLNIANLLPKDKQSFYRYRGSLTTPPCYESVVWTVFAEPQKISVKQLAVLRHLILEEHGDAGNKHAAHSHASTSTNMVKYMVNNYRPFQPLHGRVVQKSFNRGTLSHAVEQHSAEEPVTAIKNNPKKNLDKFKNLAQPDNTFGPLNINTILSGANSFPGSPSHSVNSAHNDKKAAATKTRIAVNEQIADIKLQSANTALLKSQTDSSSLNQGPSVSIALTILNSNPTTTPVTVMLSTSPSDMTTKHLLNTMPTQKPTYSASRHAATDAGVRRIDVYNAAIRNSFPRPTPNSKLVHPIGNHDFQGHDRRFSVNGYGTTQVREVIPSNTHSIGQGAGPVQLTYNNGHSSYSRGIYIPSAAQYPHRNNNPSTINSNQGYHSPPNRQDIIVSGGPPNQEPRRPNPFRQHAPFTSSQFIPIPNRRPQPVPQPTTIPNPWLLDRAQPQRQELYGQLPPPGLFLSEPRAIDPYPRRQRPTTINKNYIFSQANPNPNHGLSIDRDILLRALQRIQAMKQTGSVKTTTTTTQSPVEQPYMLMNPSRDPVRVTNKFAHGIYDRYGAAYPSLGSAVARP